MKLNKPLFSICLYLYLISLSKCDSTNDENMLPMPILTDKTFDIELNNHLSISNKNKYFIMFQADEGCFLCKKFKNIIENNVTKTFSNNDKIKMAKIDIYKNPLLNIRFNISKIPYTVLFTKGKMFEFKKVPAADEFIAFINEEQDDKVGKEIPEKIGYLYIVKIIIVESYSAIKEYVEDLLEKYGYKIKVRDDVLIGGICFLLVLIGIYNYLICSCCCRLCCGGKKKKDKKEMKNKKEEDKENKNKNKKEGVKEKTE